MRAAASPTAISNPPKPTQVRRLLPKAITRPPTNATSMFIRVSDPTLVNDLRDQLRRAGCIAVQMGLDTLEVAVPDAPTRGQEAREVRVYVRTWTAAHGVEADVVTDQEYVAAGRWRATPRAHSAGMET